MPTFPSIKDFVEALSASWPAALAAPIGSSAVALAKYFGLAIVDPIPSWVISIAFVIAVFSAAMLIVSMIRWIGSLIMRFGAKRSWERLKRKQLADLASLPKAELIVVTWAAANKTQVISAPLFQPAIQALRAKGLIEDVPGYQISDRVSFRIPDHIWEVVVQEYARSPIGDVLRGKPFPNPGAYTMV